MIAPFFDQAGVSTLLSVTDGCRWRGGDEMIMTRAKSPLRCPILDNCAAYIFRPRWIWFVCRFYSSPLICGLSCSTASSSERWTSIFPL